MAQQQQKADLASQVLAEATRPMSSVEYTRTGGDVQEYRKGYLPQVRASVTSVLFPARQAYEAYQRTIGQPFQQAVRGGVRGFFGLPMMSDADPTGREAYRVGETVGFMPGPNVPAGAGRALVEGLQALPSAAAELATFIGAAAKTWDAASNARAVEMEKAGVNPRDIWRETGNWRAPDGMWRQEISDAPTTVGRAAAIVTPQQIAQNEADRKRWGELKNQMRVTSNQIDSAKGKKKQKLIDDFMQLRTEEDALNDRMWMFRVAQEKQKEGKVKDLVQGPILEAYPDFGEFTLRDELPFDQGGGHYDKQGRRVVVEAPENVRKQVFVHEGQHHVQSQEGFSPGNVPEGSSLAAHQKYLRGMGEAEARATQKRIPLSDEERRALFPEESYDIPISLLFDERNLPPRRREVLSAPAPGTRSVLQSRARELGLPATGRTDDIARLVNVAQSDPSKWTKEDFDRIAPYLSVHQDMRPGAETRVNSILSEGLSKGMVDNVDDLASGKRWSWGKSLQGVPAYVFIGGALKYQGGNNPRLAPGNKPLFVLRPSKNQSFYEALQTARPAAEPVSGPSPGTRSNVNRMTNEQVEQEIQSLMPRVTRAYESGNVELAQRLDDRLERLMDSLESRYTELEEDTLTKADLTNEMRKFFASQGEMGDTEADLVVELANRWKELNTPGGIYANEEPAQFLRSALEDFDLSRHGGLKEGVTDQQVIDAAKDAYESVYGRREKQAQRMRKQSPEGFAEGGEVRPEPAESPSFARQAYEAYQRAIGQPFQQAVRGGIRGYFGLPMMSDADSIGREAYRQGEAIGFTPGVGMPAGAVRAAAEGVQALPSIAGDLGRILSTIPFRGSGRGAPGTEVATQTPEFREVIPLPSPAAPAAPAAPGDVLRLPGSAAPRLEGPTAAPALEAPVQAPVQAPRLEGPAPTPLLEAPAPVLRLPSPAAAAPAAPAAPATPVARQPKAARPAAQPSPVSSSATREGNFYSPLDDFAQTLRGPVTKEQLLGQMKGKFRDHEIRRVEEILSARGPRDKVQPQELQAALKQTYSPDKWITRVVPPDSSPTGRTKYFHGMDNPYTDRPLGVIHLYQKPQADQLAAFQQAEEAAKHLKALHGRMSISATGYTTPDQLASVFKPLDTDPVLQRLPELPQIRQLQQEFMGLYQQQQQQLEYMQEAYNQAFWPTLSKRFIREKDQFPSTTDWTQIFRMEDELRDRIASEGRQEIARLFPNVDVTKASEVNNAVRNSVSAMPITMRMSQVTDDMRTLLNASYDKFTSNLKPLYTGDPTHRSLRTPEGHIAFSRYSEHEASIPGIGQAKGIYVNELQSDLLDDLRKKGPRSKSAEADTAEVQQLRQRLKDTALKDEERKALETRAQLLENRIFRSRTPGQRTYELDEPFAQAETNRQAFQQLMVKNAVAAASEMGMNFVAFPGAESAQAQLYKNLPNNLKQVVKDLGPGFEYRSITLSGPKGEMMHPAIVWNPDGAPADRIRNQGIPFKDGGEVRRSTARQMLAELA